MGVGGRKQGLTDTVWWGKTHGGGEMQSVGDRHGSWGMAAASALPPSAASIAGRVISLVWLAYSTWRDPSANKDIALYVQPYVQGSTCDCEKYISLFARMYKETSEMMQDSRWRFLIVSQSYIKTVYCS
jgi:hypothetical protein